MRPLIHDGSFLYDADGTEIKEVANLGWILRHWKDVERIRVTPIFKTDDVTNPDHWDCAVIFYLNDGRYYATPFASSSVCLDWLDRPVFRGRPLSWFGYEGVCGGEKHRYHGFNYKWEF
jgi:hypothetical protein